MSLLEATDVTVRFVTQDTLGRKRVLTAVAGVSLSIGEGERLGIVGESGSGKTTLGKALLALEPVAGGTVHFRGQEVHALRGQALLAFRRGAQMVFQDPMGALNPRMKIGTALAEVLSVHHLVPRVARRDRVAELLDLVGLNADYAGRYPHEFSGGQRQRVGIARALALNPAVMVADEPVSALDVSVQAQVLNLIRDISEARKMACILIAHDLAVVSYVCQQAMVMYLGRVAESGPSDDVFGEPLHPYTQALKAAVPDPDAEVLRDDGVRDQLLSAGSPSSGCGFAPRCPDACERCRQEQPPLRDVGNGRKVACHKVKKNNPG
jgi:oligopeptide/dipeptide ABC transporter ATP-binding protein